METAKLRKKHEESERKEEDLIRQLQAMEAILAEGMGQGNSVPPSALPVAASHIAATIKQALNLGANTLDENEGPRSA